VISTRHIAKLNEALQLMVKAETLLKEAYKGDGFENSILRDLRSAKGALSDDLGIKRQNNSYERHEKAMRRIEGIDESGTILQPVRTRRRK